MAVQRSHSKKAPTQNPVDTFKCVQQGGAHGTPTRVGDKLSGGPQREHIMGRKNLGKQ